MENIAGQLHNEIAKVCPIIGVSIGSENDKSTYIYGLLGYLNN